MTQDSQLWKDHLQHAAVSDIGMRRTTNQDSYSIEMAGDLDSWRRRGHLFLVADGMGAHAAGELASKLAADSVPHLYYKHLDLSGPESLKRAVIETNAEINRKGQANQDFHNMGTTCSVLTLLPQGAVLAHVGDSRVYRLRNHLLEQLTFDHSLVWEMCASGQSNPNSDLDNMIPRNVITRSLGPYPDVKVDIEGPFPIEEGDIFLLCSDGLVGEVQDSEIGTILDNLPPKESAQALVDLANLRGGPDNITVLVCQVTGAQLASSQAANQPLTVGSRPPSRTVLPILWAVFIASLLAGGLLAILQAWPFVIALGVVALFTLLGILLKQFGSELGGTIISGTRRFGRGPYSKTPAAADRAFLDNLVGMVDELRGDEELGLDLTATDAALNDAQQAIARGDSPLALKTYVRVLSGLLKQLREAKG